MRTADLEKQKAELQRQLKKVQPGSEEEKTIRAQLEALETPVSEFTSNSASSSLTWEVVEEIEHLVSHNKVLEAIERLLGLPECRKEAIIFSKRWYGIKEQERLQTLSSSDVGVETNRLAKAILDLLREVAKKLPVHNVFIAYAEEDSEKAENLYRALEQENGISPWMLSRNLQLSNGVLFQVLQRCSYFLVLLSASSLTEDAVLKGNVKNILELVEKIPNNEENVIALELDEYSRTLPKPWKTTALSKLRLKRDLPIVGSNSLQNLQIDVEIPGQLTVNQPIELIIQANFSDVCLEEGDQRAEIYENENSNLTGLKFRAAGGIVPSNLAENLEIPPNGPSGQINFSLTPTKKGKGRMTIEVYTYDEKYLGEMLVESCVVSELSRPAQKQSTSFIWPWPIRLEQSRSSENYKPDLENLYSESETVFSFETTTVYKNEKIVDNDKPKGEQHEAKQRIVKLDDDTDLEMIAISNGNFLMGPPQSKDLEEGDPFSAPSDVRIFRFYMSKYPITQAQWRAIAKRPCFLKLEPFNWKYDKNRPAENISWIEAVEFCRRLSLLTGRNYRLPSEAEWEYACRAGTETPFYFGETITSDLANYNGTKTYADEPPGHYSGQTVDVGNFHPNVFGLYDMHGNVWEWCADSWHEGAPADGRIWISGSSEERVKRGGGWDSSPQELQSRYRASGHYAERTKNCGFRVVYSEEEDPEWRIDVVTPGSTRVGATTTFQFQIGSIFSPVPSPATPKSGMIISETFRVAFFSEPSFARDLSARIRIQLEIFSEGTRIWKAVRIETIFATKTIQGSFDWSPSQVSGESKVVISLFALESANSEVPDLELLSKLNFPLTLSEFDQEKLEQKRLELERFEQERLKQERLEQARREELEREKERDRQRLERARWEELEREKEWERQRLERARWEELEREKEWERQRLERARQEELEREKERDRQRLARARQEELEREKERDRQKRDQEKQEREAQEKREQQRLKQQRLKQKRRKQMRLLLGVLLLFGVASVVVLVLVFWKVLKSITQGYELPLRSKAEIVAKPETLGLIEQQEQQSDYEFGWVPKRFISNDFEALGEVVSDHATGLMWQQAGSETRLTYEETLRYVDDLKHRNFAGYHDWRLPTLPELLSLLEPEKQANNIFINPIFDTAQDWCWSADTDPSKQAWIVRFRHGFVHLPDGDKTFYVRAVRSISPEAPQHRLVQLRSAPKTVAKEDALQKFHLIQQTQEDDDGAFELWRPRQYLDNNFELRDALVLDHASGLIWQQSGSEDWLRYEDAEGYVAQLNREKFAGYDDWRLPTVPELMSLLLPEKQSHGAYIATIFDAKQIWCWSVDRLSADKAWGVRFRYGNVSWARYSDENNYVRAVRSFSRISSPHTSWRDPETTIVFVGIPAGCFQMGSPEGEAGRDPDEGPVHEVCVDEVWLGRYEVTQGQWKNVMENMKKNSAVRNDPVGNMTWDAVRDFLRTLNDLRDDVVYRLPTEAEWEYACRAGTSTAYSFGDEADELDTYGWYSGNSEERPHPVGTLKANPWGLYDMHGNMWEMCQDWYDEQYYAMSPSEDRGGPASGDFHVLRGGSWYRKAQDLRCAHRYSGERDSDFDDFGIRLAVSRVETKPLSTEEEKALHEQFGLQKQQEGKFEFWRPQEYPETEFVAQRKVVVDRTHGLMWQKAGSERPISYHEAHEYVRQLNREKFAGYSDWRLPTLAELILLLTPNQENGDLYIDSMFDATQRRCWSAEKRESTDIAWIVTFHYGNVYWWHTGKNQFVRAVRSLSRN